MDCEMEETLIERTYKGLDLGESFAKTKTSLKNFKDRIEELKSFENGSELFLHEYFLNLRNEIDIHREMGKVAIDKHFLGLIDEVDKIEAECMGKSVGILREIDIKKFEKDFESLRADLDKLEINFVNWESIFYQSNEQVCKLKNLMKSLQNDLLLNKSYKYSNCDENLDAAIKSSMIVTNKIDSAKSFIEFGSFCFRMDEIHNFSKTEDSILKSLRHVFNGTKWYVEIRNRDNLEMECYVCSGNKEGQEDIETSFTLHLLNNDPLKNKTGKSTQTTEFVYVSGNRSSSLISFKELFAGTFYDKENDSIYIRVDIRYLNT